MVRNCVKDYRHKEIKSRCNGHGLQIIKVKSKPGPVVNEQVNCTDKITGSHYGRSYNEGFLGVVGPGHGLKL